MHPQLRHARFNLIVFLIVLVPTVCTYLVLLLLHGPRIAFSSVGFLGLLFIWVFGSRFYRRKPGEPGVVMDERDQLIRDRANLLGWRVVWGYWCLICFVPYFCVAFAWGIEAIKDKGIPAGFYPLFYGGAFIVYYVTWSLAIVFSYREASQA
ncbi:MAG TPA: hypothetical protein VMZ06_06190 [Candidatus Bathyarchaeia archaeon]|nr:hypothetical protein [Candidatus Bathyarchaeia archaeon]